MKTYINAKLQIVRANDDIVTTSVLVGDAKNSGDWTATAPGRKSIWD